MTDERLDVLVTCHDHGDRLQIFPQVRGYYLAKHLARSGLRAEFRQLPAPGVASEVVIVSEYQHEMDWFGRYMEGPLAGIGADRMFCMIAFSLAARPDHFSRPYCEWFAARGGVLCHLTEGLLLPHERWIGLGVDLDVVPAGDGPRDEVVFDFPRSSRRDTASEFDPGVLDAIRARRPELRLVGSGPADAVVRDAFDTWVPYGQDHDAYVAAAFSRAVAFVPGWYESMGLPIAEAQVAGACVVSSEYQVRDEMLVPEAAIAYRSGDAGSLADALAEVGQRDAEVIRAQAVERFDFAAVVERTRAAIGLA
jgi:hypothetical protein